MYINLYQLNLHVIY